MGVGDTVLERVVRSVLGRLGLLAVQHIVELLVLSTDQELLQLFPVAVERVAPTSGTLRLTLLP